MKLVLRITIVSLAAVTVSLSLLRLPRTAVAQANPPAFEKAISEDVVAVASVDLTKVDLLKLDSWAAEVSLLTARDINELKSVLTLAQDAFDKLTKNDVQRISLLYRLSDFRANTYSPSWVAELKAGGDATKATQALKATLDMFQLDKRVLQARDGMIFGGPSEAEIDSLFAESDAAKRDLAEAIKNLDQHTAGFIVLGNQETRRVVREMLPDLPKPFSEATRDLIADHTDWGGLFLDLPPTANLKLIVQARDQDSAQTIARLSTATVEYANRKIRAMDESTDKTFFSNFAKGFSKNRPQITDRQVVIDAQSMLTDRAFLKSVYGMFRVESGQK